MEEFVLIDQKKCQFYQAKEIKNILNPKYNTNTLCKTRFDMSQSMMDETKRRERIREEEKRIDGMMDETKRRKRIENIQKGANKEQKEENNMEVDTPMLVQKGNGVDIQLKGKCLHTVLEESYMEKWRKRRKWEVGGQREFVMR